jgi:hypothetical protein
MGMGGRRHATAALGPFKTRYPLYKRLGGLQGRSRRVRKISPPTGILSPDRPARNESAYTIQNRCMIIPNVLYISLYYIPTICLTRALFNLYYSILYPPTCFDYQPYSGKLLTQRDFYFDVATMRCNLQYCIAKHCTVL